MWALIVAVGFCAYYPLLLILANSFNTADIGATPAYGLGNWVAAWAAAGVFSSLANTFWLTLWYQLLSFPMAIFVAWLLARTNLPWARGFELLFWLSFFIPDLAATLGWMLLLDPHTGVVNQALASVLGTSNGPFNIYSFGGIVWVHLMAHAVSLKVMLLTPAFRNMDASLEDAGRMSGASSWSTFVRVTVPLMTPALVIVFMLAVVRLFESFQIEQLLGVPFGFYVYSTRILQLIQHQPQLIGQASALGSVTLVVLAFAVTSQRWLTTRRSYVTITGRTAPRRVDLGLWRWPVFALLGLLTLLLVVVPLCSVLVGSFMTRYGWFTLSQPWTLVNWQRALGDSVFLRSLANTLILAITAGLVGPFIFSLVAYVVVRAKAVRGRGLLDSLLWVPSAIPGALVGLGLVWMFLGIPVFRPIYGTLLALIVAVVLSGATLATQMCKAAMLQLGQQLEEASRMSGAGVLRTYVRIVLPLLAPTLVVVGILEFLFAANATANVVMLATADTRPLSLLTLDFVAEDLREPAAVTTMVISALTLGAALLARSRGFRAGLSIDPGA
jgi:iron(III) transport system permease protein